MKKNKEKVKKYKVFDIIGLCIIVAFISFGAYFIFGLTSSFLDENKNITSDQVWCNNCQTYHDKATAQQETQKLVWCTNCNKYHAPDQQ